MITVIKPRPLRGQVTAPASKSQAHRALICAALAGAGSHVVNIGSSDDVRATLGALKALGAEFEEEEGGVLVTRACSRAGNALIDCRACGATLRFLLPVALALGGEYRFTGVSRLFERPHEALIKSLETGGCRLIADSSGITASGKLRSMEYTVEASVSSQYLSGMLLALPILGGEASLKTSGRTVSAPYISLTTREMETFGVMASEQNGLWHANGEYKPASKAVEGDWSAAANWLTAGALRGIIRVEGLMEDSLQGDKNILSMLVDMNAQADRRGYAVRITHARLTSIDIDVTDTPDIVPLLAVAAACANGVSEITGAARLRGKESDRIETVREMIEGLGGIARVTPDGLVIRGTGLRGGEICSHGDHRIAMAAAVAASACTRDVTILGAECVAKSYPAFFTDYESLGGDVEYVQ